jgi:hypothetical protein
METNHRITRAESPAYLSHRTATLSAHDKADSATKLPGQAVCLFSSALNQKRVISAGGGAPCRRGGETPASRLFNRTPQLESPGSEPYVISLGRSNDKIRPVHQDPNAAVLVHPRITRNAEDDLIPKKPAFAKAPIGPSTSRIIQMRDPHPCRTYRTGLEKDNRQQSDVIVEYLEIPFLKVGNTLSGRRHNYDIETNASRSITTSGRILLRRARRNAKHHRRQARKYALVDQHRLTSTKASLSNSIPGRPSCACPIHGAVSSRHEQTKHSLLGTPRLQPWASQSEATRGALAPGVCPPFHTDLIFLKAQSNFQSTTAPLTPTIKWNQVPTVRRKPDCTI